MTSGPTELVARRFPKMAASESGAGLGLGVAKPGNPAAQRRGAVTHVGLGLGIERPEGGLHKAVAGKGKSLPDFVVSGGGSGVAVSQGGDHVSAPLGWPEKIAALAVAAAEGHGQEGVEEDPAEEGQEQVEEDVEKENEGGGDAAEGEHGEKEEEEEKRGEEEASEVAEKKGGGVSYNPYGFLAGDPILNQNLQSSRYVDPCERTMNCPTAEDEEKNAKWRSIKQHRMDASELMERQLVQLLLKAQRGAEECEQGFPDDEAKMAKCTQDHLQRACDR